MNAEQYEQLNAYLERGWSIIPIKRDSKLPLVKWQDYQKAAATEEQVAEWAREYPGCNWGVVTGKISGITVLDFDGDRGLEEAKKLDLPATLVHRSPKGWHVIGKYDPEYPQTAGIRENVDIRNDGGYVMMPPSQIGEREYVVYRDHAIAELPDFEELFAAKKVKASKDPDWVSRALKGQGQGKRNDTAAKLAGHYRRKNINRDEALSYLLSYAQKCDPPLAEQEVEAVLDSVYRYSLEIENVRVNEQPEFQQIGFDLQYQWPQYGIEAVLTNLNSERSGGLWCELEITLDYPGARQIQYGPKRINLLTSFTRDVSALQKMQQADWDGVLNLISRHAIKFYREGADVEDVMDLEVDYEYDPWLLPPLVIEDGLTILFGDGGLGKSTVALAAMLAIQSGHELLGEKAKSPRKGLYLDWEDSSRTMAMRARKMLNGSAEDIGRVLRLQCSYPLTDLADTIRRKIVKENIGFVVVDSVAAACGGDASSQDVVTRFFNAVHSFGVPVLGIAHQTKNVTDTHKPFGSVYWVNSSRATVELIGSQEAGSTETHLVLTNRKNNHGSLLPPVGVKVTHSKERILVTRETPQYRYMGSGEPTTKELVVEALRDGPKTVSAISEIIQKHDASVRTTLNRSLGFTFYKVSSSEKVGESTVWGLTSSRDTLSNQAPRDTRVKHEDIPL